MTPRLTVHAVEQYQTRYAPDKTLPVAMAELRQHVATMRRVGPAPTGGDEYECSSGLRVVLRQGRGCMDVVTVLPPNGAEVAMPARHVESEAEMRERSIRRVLGYLEGRCRKGDKEAVRLLHDVRGLLM